MYSGPPSGPLEVVRRIPECEDWEPGLVDVDGGRVLIVEGTDDATRSFILDPASGLVPIAWADDTFTPVAIAGAHAAVVAVRPRRVAVVDAGARVLRAAGR